MKRSQVAQADRAKGREWIGSGPKPTDEELVALAALVDAHVLSVINWYQRKKRGQRRLHRLTSALLVIFGALIPVINLLSDAMQSELLVSVLGLSVSVVAGFSATLEWRKNWQVFSIAQNTLEARFAEWDLAMSVARSMTPVETARKKATDATQALLEATNEVRLSETREFFSADRSSRGTVQNSSLTDQQP